METNENTQEIDGKAIEQTENVVDDGSCVDNGPESSEETQKVEFKTDSIRDGEAYVLSLSIEHTKAVEMARSIKNEALAKIEAEFEETGDKALSNATKRGAALEKSLAENEVYLSLIESSKQMALQMRSVDIEIAFFKREFRREMGKQEQVQEITISLASIAESLRIAVTLPR